MAFRHGAKGRGMPLSRRKKDTIRTSTGTRKAPERDNLIKITVDEPEAVVVSKEEYTEETTQDIIEEKSFKPLVMVPTVVDIEEEIEEEVPEIKDLGPVSLEEFLNGETDEYILEEIPKSHKKRKYTKRKKRK